MSTNTHAQEIQTLTQRFVHEITVALIFFTVAWFFLTVGVFTFYPPSPAGLTCLAIGLLCLLISIIYFIRYALTSKKVREITE